MFQWSQEELTIKINAFISTMEILLGVEKESFSCMHEILSGTKGRDENTE